MRQPGRMHYGAPSSVLSALPGLRILITGAARGIGAQAARRLHGRGAKVALAGIEPELLGQVAADCDDALAVPCDVRDRAQVEAAVAAAVDNLGGLDVVVANAGVASLMPIAGGDPAIFERTIEVNLLGVYYTLRAAAPHISHDRGYALSIASLAAAVHPPLMGAYSAAKAGRRGDVRRAADRACANRGARRRRFTSARLDTEMVSRGFRDQVAGLAMKVFHPAGPFSAGVAARGRDRRDRARDRPPLAPRRRAALGRARPAHADARPALRRPSRRRRGLDQALAIAREETDPLTTELPER